ncbi:MAG: TIGR02444 family protein [Rhodovibrionaceae bacterium]|nr:TIGR02444 family protein [Rhodovibrionaceae bacterium]
MGRNPTGSAQAPDSDKNPFWSFSLEIYARPGVAPACIALQDRLGLDVNLLLYLCWRASLGLAVEAEELADLMVRAALWQSRVVQPLRAVRRALKGQDMVDAEAGEDLRERVKALELEAERLEQAMLREALRDSAGQPLADQKEAALMAAGNIAVYLRAAGVEPGLEDVADLAALLRGSFPQVPPLEAVWMLRP